MANPYGSDIVSPIPRPRGGGGEIVPRPGLPPGGVPSYLRPIPINLRDPREVLNSYLDANSKKVARVLYSTWNNERAQITFQEIRNAARDRQVPIEWIQQWQQDYSRFVTQVLDPDWRAAMRSGGETMTAGISAVTSRTFQFSPTSNAIEEWITTRGTDLAVALTDQQHAAMRSLIRHYTLDQPVGVDELGRILRPVIGLTPKQATAVQAFRDKLIKDGLSFSEVEHQVGNYTGRLWRMRGLRIARTEESFAHVFGQRDAIKQAQQSGQLFGQVVKRWRTNPASADPFCRGLNGQRVNVDETFPGLTAKVPNVYGPPAHPNCGCGLTYELLKAA